jgi:hypothetical protein
VSPRIAILVPLLAGSFAGCGSAEVEFTERKRIDEVLTRREVAEFLHVAESLPAGPLAELEPVFAPLPDWDGGRTLPVSELLRTERESLENRWDTAWLTRREKPSRRLQRALARTRMSHEQFVALALSIGATLSRATLRPDQDLERIEKRGRAEWTDLERDVRPFASLPPEVRYRTLQRAAWVTRADRAERIGAVPAENVAVVEEFRERLAAFFPPSFLENPFDAILDPLDEYGVPFHEPDADRDDARLRWSRDDALVGTDAPDPAFDGEDRHESDAVPRRLTHGAPPDRLEPSKQ